MPTININQFVKVKLTDAGRKVITDYIADQKNQGHLVFLSKPPEEDEQGYLHWPFWHLMVVFGSSMHNGLHSPFEKNEIIIGDNNE